MQCYSLARHNLHNCRQLLLSFCVATYLFALGSPAFAKDVNLKVLVISTGTASQDLALDLIDDVLNNAGVAYEVLNSRTETLTAQRLFNASHGNYSGVILTSSELYVSDTGNGQSGSGFDLTEWQTLHQYERDFGIRESVISGWPSVNASLDLDYGLQYVNFVSRASPVQARWMAPAGGTEFFEYVNSANPLTVDDYALITTPTLSATGPVVTPLLTVGGDANQILVASLKYPDGREVLYSSIANAPYLLHSQLLAYEFVNFSAKGVFLGARQVHFTTHIDDLFVESSLWNSQLNTDDPVNTFRMTSADVTNALSAQTKLRQAHPTARNFTLDFAFNGMGANSLDPLTQGIVANKSKFRFINHTFSHLDMTDATYGQASSEIADNRAVWLQLGLPGMLANIPTLVTGKHSGLRNLLFSFPEGVNTLFFDAARDSGVGYLASDSSQPNENIEQYAPGYPIVMLPRRPTAVFYNVAEPNAWVDEYNYIFNERFTDPCSVPGAICTPRNYSEILAAEAELAMRQIFEYRMWPYFMHQANLNNYDNAGSTVLFDWINAVLARYERNMKLPFYSLPYSTIGVYTKDRIAARSAVITGNWNLDTNSITMRSDKTVKVWTTGIGGGSLYGGQRQRYVTLQAGQTQSYTLDRALAN